MITCQFIDASVGCSTLSVGACMLSSLCIIGIICWFSWDHGVYNILMYCENMNKVNVHTL